MTVVDKEFARRRCAYMHPQNLPKERRFGVCLASGLTELRGRGNGHYTYRSNAISMNTMNPKKRDIYVYMP